MTQDNSSKEHFWKIIIGGTIGNLNEWYNFLLYGYLASIMSAQFFPATNKTASLILVFIVFALGFLARPVGGILFGRIGDIYGRQRALVISMIMMLIPTFIIGCLPSYQQIGILSPILMSICRVTQGLSAGGEHTGSAIYLAEHAPPKHQILWISTVPTSAAFGILISSAAALLIINSFSENNLLAWGWRIGFWAGTALCIISLILRLRLPETPLFKEILEKKLNINYSVSDILKNPIMLKKLLVIFSLSSCWGIIYQLLFVWMPTYLSHFHHFNNNTSLALNSIFLLLFATSIVCIGYLANYTRIKSWLIFSCIAMFIFAYPLFMMLSSGQLWLIYIGLTIFTLLFANYLLNSFVIMIKLFPVNLRYTGLSFGFNMGLAIFGGTCPLIVTWLISITQNNNMPAFYVMLASLVALITIAAIKIEL